jgi:hypothetical protein
MSNSVAVATDENTLPIQAPDMPGMYERAPDVQSPSIYLMHGLSTAVTEGIARPGEVILALGKDDTNPDWLIGGESDADYFDAVPIRREVSYAILVQGEDMEWIDKERFDVERDNGNRDAWIVYRYVLSVPSHDAVLPVRLMLTKTAGRQTARSLNTIIDKAAALGQFPQVRFSVTQKVGRDSKQKYFALAVGSTHMSREDLAVAASMQKQVALFAQSYATENVAAPRVEQPAI